MGIVIRQSLKGAITQYIGVLIGYVNLLYILPYCLSPAENGLFRLLIETATFFALFAQIGIPNSIPRFGAIFKVNGRHKLFNQVVLILPIISIPVFILFYYYSFRDSFNAQLSKDSSLFLNYEIILIPLGIAIVYSNIIENLIANYYRITVPKIIRDVFIRIGIGLSCLIYYLNELTLSKFFSFISINYLFGFLLLFGYFIYIKHSKPITISEPKAMDKGIWASFSKYLALIVISGIGTNLVNKLDIFMVSSKLGLVENSIYTTAFLITMIIEIPTRSFQQIVSPIISESIYLSKNRNINWAYKKSSTAQGYLAIVILTLLMLNMNWIFNTMPNGEIYILGVNVILFLGIAKVFDSFTGINGLILANSKYYYVGIYFTVALAVLAIWLNNIFIPIYGVLGAAIATAISIMFYNLLMSIYVWKKFKIHPISKSSLSIFRLLLFSIIFYYLHTLEFASNSFVWSVIFSSLFIIVCVIQIIKTNVLLEFKKATKSLLKTIRL